MKKVLAVVGGFFVKIGRWIANTAWVQPLLIVGGIFAIIFSIPYIKQGIEGLQTTESVDEATQYYKDRAISLTGAEDHKSDFDKLLSALEGKEVDNKSGKDYIKAKYGEKFFLSLGKEDCAYCKECVGGYKYLNDNFKSLTNDETNKFKFVTVMLDTTNDDDEYLAKYVFEEHQDFFDEVGSQFAEWDDYALLNNISASQKSSLIASIEKLENATDDNGQGLDTPTTFLIDFTATSEDAEVKPFNITAIFCNYVDYLSAAKYPDTTNLYKGSFLADAWTYSKLFEKDWARNNNA